MADSSRVILKLNSEYFDLPYDDGVQARLEGIAAEAWNSLAALFPNENLSIDRLVQTSTEDQVRRLMELAEEAAGEETPNLLSLRAIPVVDSALIPALVEAVKSLPFVEYAYSETPLIPAAVNPSDDPLASLQGYLMPAPFGVGAFSAWALPGSDGAGVRFLDIEYGWNLNHPDLAGAGVLALNASVPGNEFHSTASLGIVLGQDNAIGVIGIAPKVQGAIASALQVTIADALVLAAGFLVAGDVLLIEQQTNLMQPVEIEPHLAMLIRALTIAGIVVIEPAGNGAANLDTLLRPDGTSFDRTMFNFYDSQAIVVGARQAATSSRAPFSCFGNRVDCHAWGEAIVTTSSIFGLGGPYTGLDPLDPINTFGGTSGASAIIAGVACSLQGIARAKGTTLIPSTMRTLMSARFNTPSPDPIGVMPDMEQIVQNF